jgi:hypothetical protein
MEVSRRDFVKVSTGIAGGTALAGLTVSPTRQSCARRPGRRP